VRSGKPEAAAVRGRAAAGFAEAGRAAPGVRYRAAVDPRPPVVQHRARPGVLDLGWGHPHPDALPVRAWGEATAAALSSAGPAALTYGYATGPGPLIEWLGDRMGLVDGRSPGPGETFVTAGASHALHLLASVLARPGDVMLVDAPTYHLALRILADTGAEVVAVPAGEQGPDVVAVEALIRAYRTTGRRVALLYLVPTFGNPTGRSLPTERRDALVAMAHRTGVPLIEDDTYRELSFDGRAPDSLWSRSEGRDVLRIGSFAKTVAPGVRLGWIDAPSSVIRRLADLGYVDSGGGVNHTAAMAMAAFGTGGYAAHVDGLRHRYRRQRDALVAGLRATPAGTGLREVPGGGWFLWYRLPEGLTADRLLPIAERHGVSFLPGELFVGAPPRLAPWSVSAPWPVSAPWSGSAASSGSAPGTGSTSGTGVDGGSRWGRYPGERYIRLSYSMLDPDDLTRAGHRLADALAEAA